MSENEESLAERLRDIAKHNERDPDADVLASDTRTVLEAAGVVEQSGALRDALVALNDNVGDLANSAVQAKVRRALKQTEGR